jgi:molybdopterin molybdotransferase
LENAHDAILTCLESFLTQRANPSQVINLAHALGRILATDLDSPIDVPAYTNSAMDGFAFQMPEPNSPGDKLRRFEIVGESLAGSPFLGPLPADGTGCIKIMTGAMLPPNLDTIAPIEMVGTPKKDASVKSTSSQAQFIEIDTTQFKSGAHRRLKGEDIAKGTCVLQKGHRLNAASMGLIASLGYAQVNVFLQPKIAIFSTGNELQKPGESLSENKIYDSNRFSLRGLLERLGCKVMDLGIVPDQMESLRDTLHEAAKTCEVIITSGGVSEGDADHTKALMKELGEVYFNTIAIRPGRPLAFGTVLDRMFFGLPGNPVAVMVTFLSLVRPAILRLMGIGDPDELIPRTLMAKCDVAIRKKAGRSEFQRGVTLVNAQGELCVKPIKEQGSGILSSMVQANCLIVLDHEMGDVQAHSWVKIWPLDGLL